MSEFYTKLDTQYGIPINWGYGNVRSSWTNKKSISEFDKNRLMDIFKELVISQPGLPVLPRFLWKTPSRGISAPGKNIILEIYESEDEWYYLKISRRVISPFDGMVVTEDNEFYKCDQFDGLVECIKNEI